MSLRWQALLLFAWGFLADWFMVGTIKATNDRHAALLAVISFVWTLTGCVIPGFIYDQKTIAGRLRFGTVAAFGGALGALTALYF